MRCLVISWGILFVMKTPRLAVLAPIIIIVCALALGVYLAYDTYRTVILASQEAARQEAKIAASESRIRDALSKVHGLSQTLINGGFWYSYRDADGNDGVYYFDLRGAAISDLDDAELAALAQHLGSSSVLGPRAISQVAESSLPPELQFHNELYRSTLGGTSTLSIGRTLAARVASDSATSDDLFELSYLSELNGDYAERDALNERNCSEFKVRCADPIQLTLKGIVRDASGAGVQGASVEIVSRPEVKAVLTDQKGEFSIQTGAKEMEKMRVHAHKRNYSDGYIDYVVLAGTPAKKAVTLDPIQLQSPINIVTIDYSKRTVTGIGNVFNQDGSVKIVTSQSTYGIPARAIVHLDGSAYTGDTVDVYLYEFTKGNPPENLLAVDTFDQVIGYAGDLMKSFGMPYIQFFAPGGEELHVLSKNPMQLTYRIPDMQALYDNTDKIYRALTPADMQRLVDASKGRPLAIDREWLIDNQMLVFPAFWVFDRKRGVWDNVGQSVLDTQGTIQTVFYTIRDAI